MKILIGFWQAELNGVVTYQTLEKLTDDEKLKETFRKTAADEGRNAAILKTYTGAELTPNTTRRSNLPRHLKQWLCLTFLTKFKRLNIQGMICTSHMPKNFLL